MLIEIFVIFELLMVGFFVTSFFTKQEILWAITAALSGIMMFTSYHIEYYVYELNTTLNAYAPVVTTHYYPYLMGINMLFFILAVILGIFDLFDKYGTKFAGDAGGK